MIQELAEKDALLQRRYVREKEKREVIENYSDYLLEGISSGVISIDQMGGQSIVSTLGFLVPLKNRCKFLSVLREENVRISDTYWSRRPVPIGRPIAARRRGG